MRSRTNSIVIKKETERASPGLFRRSLPYVGAILLVTLLCVTINYQAISEYRREEAINRDLNARIENATSENLSLQEEIHYLKTDVETIEREARKLGLENPKEKVLKPTK